MAAGRGVPAGLRPSPEPFATGSGRRARPPGSGMGALAPVRRPCSGCLPRSHAAGRTGSMRLRATLGPSRSGRANAACEDERLGLAPSRQASIVRASVRPRTLRAPAEGLRRARRPPPSRRQLGVEFGGSRAAPSARRRGSPRPRRGGRVAACGDPRMPPVVASRTWMRRCRMPGRTRSGRALVLSSNGRLQALGAASGARAARVWPGRARSRRRRTTLARRRGGGSPSRRAATASLGRVMTGGRGRCR